MIKKGTFKQLFTFILSYSERHQGISIDRTYDIKRAIWAKFLAPKK
jgi:hypothetical protein